MRVRRRGRAPVDHSQHLCEACGASLSAAGSDPPRIMDARAYTPHHLVEHVLTTRAALEGERKHVTLLFADIADSMSLAEGRDPEERHGTLDRVFDILARIVHRFELQGVGPLRTRFDASARRGLSRLVGREAEIAWLDDILSRSAESGGRWVGVVGDAGVGKSRLCREFTERCRARGVAVYEAHCPHTARRCRGTRCASSCAAASASRVARSCGIRLLRWSLLRRSGSESGTLCCDDRAEGSVTGPHFDWAEVRGSNIAGPRNHI